MSELLITADDVGKKFCRDLKRSLWYGVRDLSADLVGVATDHSTLRAGEFWANKGVSFTLRRGETLGLVGHNGAGKTTLLRMLNGLITPDIGRIEVRGRMQALIALGAGFNPVLSGRENIYVNAAVLGLTKRQTDAILEQIIDFSGIGEFIDAPVQSYSSGMGVRLGFAVAAHMEPDILLIDEVLAVGDVAFKRKCYAKIREFRNRGVGIIVVTHDMSQVYNLCDSAILLSHGTVAERGTVDDVVKAYFEANRSTEASARPSGETAPDSLSQVRISKVTLLDAQRQVSGTFRTGEPMTVKVEVESPMRIERPVIGIGLSVPGAMGGYLTAVNTKLSEFTTTDLIDRNTFYCEMPSVPLYPGRYDLIVTLNDEYGLRFDSLEGDTAIRFEVAHGRMGGGDFYIPHHWVQQTP